MDEKINIRANGNTLTKDYGAAGTQGEVNSTKLRITFAENWDGFAKKITFWNAVGENPVDIQLGTNLLEDVVVSPRVYIVPVPGEAMTEAGECTFVIEGTADNVVKRSIEGKLKVTASRSAKDAGIPSGVTPDLATQIRGEIDGIVEEIAEVKGVKIEVNAMLANLNDAIEDARQFAENANTSAAEASQYMKDAQDACEEATGQADKAYEQARQAEAAKDAIEDMTVTSESIGTGEAARVEKTVGDVVNLHFSIPKGEPGVRIGEGAPPDDVLADEDVKAWIDLNGEPDEYVTREEMNRAIERLAVPSYAFVTLLGGSQNWTAEDVTDSAGTVIGCRYGQTVNVNNAVITENSKVDLLITSEQMVVFYEKDLAFVTENDDGVVTVYCVGNIPEHDYKIQAIVTEVFIDG